MKPIVCSVANGFWICLDFICFPGNKLLLLGWPSYLSNSGDVWNTWHQHVRPPKVYSDFVIYVICILGISGNLCSISFTCHHFPIYIYIFIHVLSIYMYHTSVVFQATRLLGISVLHLSGLPAVSIKSGRGATSNVEIWYPHGLEKESSPGLLAGSSFTDSHMSKMSLAQKNSRQIQFLKDSKNNHSTQLLLWTSILNNKELRRKRMHSSTHRSRWPAGKKKTASKAIWKQWNLRRSARQCIWLYQYSTELKHRNEGKVHLSILHQFLQPKHISRNSGKSIVPFPSQSTSLIMSCKISRTATNNRL